MTAKRTKTGAGHREKRCNPDKDALYEFVALPILAIVFDTTVTSKAQIEERRRGRIPPPLSAAHWVSTGVTAIPGYPGTRVLAVAVAPVERFCVQLQLFEVH
eukprot:251676-Rhodomonas_salina.1